MAGHRPFSELREKMKPMTATEVRTRAAAAWADLDLVYPKTAIGSFEHLAEADIGTLERTLERIQESRRPEIGLAEIASVGHFLDEKLLRREALSLTIPMRDFVALSGGDFSTRMNCCGVELLCGRDGVHVWLALPPVIEPNREALNAEILRRLGWNRVRELPKSTGSDGVSPGAETVGEIGVTARAAGRDNRDSDRPADLSDEAKIIAAKAAIAAYGRDKQLPGAATLALFGELDYARACNDSSHRAWDAPVFYDIERNDHSLSAEPLSRAIDQIWIRENGGAYADLVCSRAERLAEMVYRGNAAADGERAE